MDQIRLADAIANLRAELTKAREAGEDQELKFAVDDITVELQLQVERSANVKGGFTWFLFSGEAEGAVGRNATHKLVLNLTATEKGGRRFSLR